MLHIHVAFVSSLLLSVKLSHMDFSSTGARAESFTSTSFFHQSGVHLDPQSQMAASVKSRVSEGKQKLFSSCSTCVEAHNSTSLNQKQPYMHAMTHMWMSHELHYYVITHKVMGFSMLMLFATHVTFHSCVYSMCALANIYVKTRFATSSHLRSWPASLKAGCSFNKINIW